MKRRHLNVHFYIMNWKAFLELLIVNIRKVYTKKIANQLRLVLLRKRQSIVRIIFPVEWNPCNRMEFHRMKKVYEELTILPFMSHQVYIPFFWSFVVYEVPNPIMKLGDFFRCYNYLRLWNLKDQRFIVTGNRFILIFQNLVFFSVKAQH